MAVGLSQSLAQQSGTVSRISSGTRQSALTLSDVYWRRICLRDTSACSAIEVDNFMRYINLLTYLLTYKRIYTVCQKYPPDSMYLRRTDKFWYKCYSETKQSNDTLFSHFSHLMQKSKLWYSYTFWNASVPNEAGLSNCGEVVTKTAHSTLLYTLDHWTEVHLIFAWCRLRQNRYFTPTCKRVQTDQWESSLRVFECRLCRVMFVQQLGILLAQRRQLLVRRLDALKRLHHVFYHNIGATTAEKFEGRREPHVGSMSFPLPFLSSFSPSCSHLLATG